MKLYYSTFLLWLMCTFFCAYIAEAQQNSFEPDRPGFSTGTYTVPPATFYIETGYQFTFRNSSDLNNSEVPAITIKTSLTPLVELFMEWDGIVIDHGINNSSSSTPSLGSKIRLYESEMLAFTFLGVINTYRGNDTFKLAPLVGVMWEVEMNNRLELFGGLQFKSDKEEDTSERISNFALGLAYELSHSWDIFAEYYNFYSLDDRSLLHASEFGILYYPTNSIQLDLFGGIGHNNKLPHYIGTGISFML